MRLRVNVRLARAFSLSMTSWLLPRAMMCTCSKPAILDTRVVDSLSGIHLVITLHPACVMLAHLRTSSAHVTAVQM